MEADGAFGWDLQTGNGLTQFLLATARKAGNTKNFTVAELETDLAQTVDSAGVQDRETVDFQAETDPWTAGRSIDRSTARPTIISTSSVVVAGRCARCRSSALGAGL
jgi:hypothetical protein